MTKHFRKVCPQCNTVVHAMDDVTAVGEPENAIKTLLSEEELLVRDKVCKASKRASEIREHTLHMQEQSRTHMISINTYHLACAEGSAFQCCSLSKHRYFGLR